MNKIITAAVIFALLGLFAPAHAGTITPEEAAKFTGSQETVCGKVVRAFYAAKAKGQPTLLNLAGVSSDRVFTVVIWGEDRNKFEKPPESLYSGKKVCVTGRIKVYRGRPEIIVRDPSQIEARGVPEVETPK
ncbi:MAG: hypothetical protein P4L55_12375 [Syntrophobacteraceae bacterium]|nr:hypothetical protein [Syntrophobacteraceae bacterium]